MFLERYICRTHGIFAMNTVAIDTEDRGFEDFLAIPDPTAGMIGAVMSLRSRRTLTDRIGQCKISA
jgi:hypothetical protein